MGTPPLQPPSEEGVFLSWAFLEACFGGAWLAIVAALAMAWRTGRRLGRFEEAYAMLESRVEANKVFFDQRAEKFDHRLDSLDQSNRLIEKAVAGLPESIARIERSLESVTARIDNINKPGRSH